MAKSGGGGGGWVLLLLAAAGVYYAKTGEGQENDAALIPNDVEGRIDFLVEALNKRFGHGWLASGVEALRSYIGRTMPPLLALVDVVSAVEVRSRYIPMRGYEKKQAAVETAQERLLAAQILNGSSHSRPELWP
jgi:hypothetical protein